MIPIELTLQGLYSYKEKQTIDFQPLIAAGLFGLFGPVGSGKSSILEAMMLALYNKTERLSHAGRNYNMMNLQSDELFIDFIFYSGLSGKEKFRSTFRSKRNSKNFDDVSFKENNFYKWDGSQWMPLDNVTDASSILGMSYDNFMKTIIIPQGKFRDFVDQTTSARTQMLKELFPLEKFDLYSKTGKLLNQTKADIQAVEKVLEELGVLGTEDISVLENEISLLKEQLVTINEKLQKYRKNEEKLRALEKLFNSFYEHAEILSQLKSDEELYTNKELQLNIYTKAYTYFKEKINTLSNFTAELKEKKVRLEKLQADLIIAEKALQSAKESHATAKEDLNEVDDTKNKCEDLKLIIELGKLTQLAQGLKVEAANAGSTQETIREKLQLAKNTVTALDQEITALEAKIQNVDELNEIFLWQERETEYLKEKHDNTYDLTELIKKESGYDNAILKAVASCSLQEQEDPTHSIENEKQMVQAEIESLQQQLMPLKVKQQLSVYTNALKEGDPCPLCGSRHHPETTKHEEVSQDLKEIDSKIQDLKSKETILKEKEKEIQFLRVKQFSVRDLIAKNQALAIKIEEKILTHRLKKPAIPEEYVNPDVVKEALVEKTVLKDKLKEKKFLKERTSLTVSDLEASFENKRNYLQEILKKYSAEEAKISQVKGMLKVYDYEKFERHTSQQLSDSLSRGLQKINNLNKVFDESVRKINDSEQLLSRLKGQLNSEENVLEDLLNKTALLDQDLQTLLSLKDFHSIQQVQEILHMNLNMDWERQEIDRYRTKVLTVEQQYNNLKKEIDNREYKKSQHQELVQEITDLEDEIKRVQTKVSFKTYEIEEIVKKMERRSQLYEEHRKLELRKENLSELCNLFRGNGFMNYVSSIYLNNLCRAANERFLLLTKNNLSLELNEQNEFIVRDFLNNGRTRLLKTLSGGQTFQASLCLALALAENVKMLNKADQSFFFLDEGFGALDKNALRVVFDTLKTLRKENRIVGIISHVEELQQEIDMYVAVENDRDSGSQISLSWK